MVRKKRTPIKYTKARVILSDVLPYEIPIIFSNRYFYRFLNEYEHEIETIKKNGRERKIITNKSSSKVVENFTKLLFGDDFNFRTIPFNYDIAHKNDDFRRLTIVHPINQLQVVDFYDKYKDLIIHYCSISPFSIRKPQRVARLKFFKDKVHKDNLSHEHKYEAVEAKGREYESLKTFFVYKDYSNIHKFYESFKHHRSEKKYNRLIKFDIQKCFESIYTHSLCWALLDKKAVKDNLTKSKKTFGGEFDFLMQDLNYFETNGIVIGPEFSRIFAELILQRIDKDVLRGVENDNFRHKIHFEIFRYVDDYFLFYDEENQKDCILAEYKIKLLDYKLRIGEKKTEIYDKPIITPVTIAKQQISDLLDQYLTFKVDESKDDGDEKFTIYVSSRILITKFKTVLKVTGVGYKDILNYTLAIIDRKIDKLLKGFKKNKFDEKKLVKAIFEILEFTFFVYAVFPKVNTTIKLCHALSRLTNFTSKCSKNINLDNMHLLKKKIYDETSLILKKNQTKKHIQIETLYLLIVLRELGREYLLEPEVLKDYFGLFSTKDYKKLNYFSIVTLLFYIKNKKRYKEIKLAVEKAILTKFKIVNLKDREKNAELVLLLLDSISCPYLKVGLKRQLLGLRNIKNAQIQTKMINWGKSWFIKWEDFNFEEELNAKKSQEVY